MTSLASNLILIKLMVRWVVIAIVVIVVFGLGGLFLFGGSSQGKSCTADSAEKTATASAEVTVAATIEYKDGEFSPECLQISPGTTVTWVNQSDKDIQIGTDPHPAHSGNKEVSNGEYVLTLDPGEEATVNVDKVGKSAYHNHLNSSAGGAIIVE